MHRLLLLAALLTACGPAGPDAGKKVAADTTDSVGRPPASGQDGRKVIRLPDGGRMEGRLRNGKRTGPWTSYFPNGMVRSRSTYIQGLEEGHTVVYHENGKPLYTGSYLHGMPYGEWIYYDPNGTELKRVVHDSTGAVVR
jgi:hypothetical protein